MACAVKSGPVHLSERTRVFGRFLLMLLIGAAAPLPARVAAASVEHCFLGMIAAHGCSQRFGLAAPGSSDALDHSQERTERHGAASDRAESRVGRSRQPGLAGVAR